MMSGISIVTCRENGVDLTLVYFQIFQVLVAEVDF